MNIIDEHGSVLYSSDKNQGNTVQENKAKYCSSCWQAVAARRLPQPVLIDDQDVYDEDLDIVDLRVKVGMIFQKPNLFPESIFENGAYGLRINGI